MDAPALFKCNVGDLIHDYLDKLLATQLVKEGYELQNIDVMALTPMDAINKLFLLREKARKL